MKWIKNHKFLTGFICTFLMLCIIITASFLSEGSTTPVGRQIENATAFIQRPIALFTFELRDSLTGRRVLMEENYFLREENARLRAEMNRLRLTERDLQEIRELSSVLRHDIMASHERIVVANVVSLDGTNWFNFFTIDRGTRDRVTRDSVVVNGDGLVGIVVEAGINRARVISVIDSLSNISFVVARDPDIIGILYGDGMGALSGFLLDDQAGIVEGDILLTSGLGEPMFPRGIEIGRVTSVNFNPETLIRTITVEPSVRFGQLRRVAVVV